jgi:hypothetical protein
VGGEGGEGDRVVPHIHVPVLPVQSSQPPMQVMAATGSKLYFIWFGNFLLLAFFLSGLTRFQLASKKAG